MNDGDASLLGLVVDLPMELAARPGGEPTAIPSAATGDRHPGQLLEDDGRAPTLGLVEEPVRDRVHPLPDAISLPSPFPTAEPSTDPSVARFLPPEAAAPFEMGLLDPRDLLERDRDGAQLLRVQEHPIQRALVGVERQERGGRVRGRSLPLDNKDRPGGGQHELLDLRDREHASVVVGKPKVEPRPLSEPEGEAEVARDRVEMQGIGVGAQEGAANVREGGGDALAEAAAMALVEGEGDVHGDTNMVEADAMVAGEGLRVSDERAASGRTDVVGVANALVDEEAKIAEKSEDRGRKRGGEFGGEGAANGGHPRESEGRGMRIRKPPNDGRWATVSNRTAR
jgi:hypothetical protein